MGRCRLPLGSPIIVSISVIAVLATAVFIAAEHQAADPIIPLALFRNRTFQVATIAGLVMAAAMFGAIAYLPTYLQMVNGLGAALKVPILSSYNDALTPVFWYLMPLVLVSMAGLLLIRAVPLAAPSRAVRDGQRRR